MLSNGVPGNTWSAGHPIFDLEYADDTLLMSLTTPQLQSILRFRKTEASPYGMSLSNTKTVYLLDSSRVPVVNQVKHLGSQVSWLEPFETTFFHRASIAKTTCKKLGLVRNSSLTKKAKLRKFQSTFRSTLIYGLDAFPLTTPQLEGIDACYRRFLKRVIGINASYYSRVPNHSVWRQAGYPKFPSTQLITIYYVV